MCKRTAIYGLVGFPLGHSYSKEHFTRKFAREGLDGEYKNFEIERIEKLTEVIDREPGLVGFNVTIPYKKQVMALLDEVSPLAREVGAVNVVKIEREADGRMRLHGYNSDCGGFLQDISPLLTPAHRKALILGNGGAAQAVATALRSVGRAVTFAGRRPGNGVMLFEDVTPEVVAGYDVIVQCTPLGMYPHTDGVPAIAYDGIGPKHVCYDVVYNPAETEFMRLCRERGATVKGGTGMLEGQARIAWRIWEGDKDAENIGNKQKQDDKT